MVKDKILNVASRLFYQQGYNLTGINQIIEEAGIAKASLYNHFKSKTDLLMAYLELAEKQWFAELDAFLKPLSGPREKILALFDHRIYRQQSSGFNGCRFIKISAEINREESRVFDFVSSYKERARKYIGELSDNIYGKNSKKSEMLAETTFLLLEGATTMGAITKNSKYMKTAKKIIQEQL